MLAIAEACGCGAEARQAALELSGADDDETDAIVLLADLKTIFEQAKAGDATIVTMSSAAIAADLASMEDKRWPEFKGGKPITPAQIAALLKPFNIAPRKVQSDGGGRKAAGAGLSVRAVRMDVQAIPGLNKPPSAPFTNKIKPLTTRYAP